MNKVTSLSRIRESIRHILREEDAEVTPEAASSIPLDGKRFPGLQNISVPTVALDSFCTTMIESFGGADPKFTPPNSQAKYGGPEYAEFLKTQKPAVASVLLTLLILKAYNAIMPNGFRYYVDDGSIQTLTASDLLTSYKTKSAYFNDYFGAIISQRPIREGYQGLIDFLGLFKKHRDKIAGKIKTAKEAGTTLAYADASADPGNVLTATDIIEVGYGIGDELAANCNELGVYARNISERFTGMYIGGADVDVIVDNILKSYDDKSGMFIAAVDAGESQDQNLRRVEITIKAAESMSAAKNAQSTVGYATVGAIALLGAYLGRGTAGPGGSKLDQYNTMRQGALDDFKKSTKELEEIIAKSPAAAAAEKDKLEKALKGLGFDPDPAATAAAAAAAAAGSGAPVPAPVIRGGGTPRQINSQTAGLFQKWVDASTRANPGFLSQSVSAEELKIAQANYNKSVARLQSTEISYGESGSPTFWSEARLTLDPSLGISGFSRLRSNSVIMGLGTTLIAAIGSVVVNYLSKNCTSEGAVVAGLIVDPTRRQSFSSSDGAMLDDLEGVFDEISLSTPTALPPKRNSGFVDDAVDFVSTGIKGRSRFDKYQVTKIGPAGTKYSVEKRREDVVKLLKDIILDVMTSDWSSLSKNLESLKTANNATGGGE